MSSIKNYSLQFVLAASLALVTGASMAQAFDTVRLYGAAPGQDGGLIGLGLVASTQYRGSDERKTAVFPLVDYQWASGWFAGTGNGLGYNLSKRTDMQYGARLTADFGRKASDSAALNGMGDVDAKAEAGVFMNYSVSPTVTLTSSLRAGSARDANGVLLDLGAVYSVAVAPQWRLATGIATTVANAGYLQSYFGVTAEQSASSGYAQYSPSAGIRDVRANVSANYRWNARTSITTGLSFSALSDEAKKSPLVRQSETTSVIVALAYAF